MVLLRPLWLSLEVTDEGCTLWNGYSSILTMCPNSAWQTALNSFPPFICWSRVSHLIRWATPKWKYSIQYEWDFIVLLYVLLIKDSNTAVVWTPIVNNKYLAIKWEYWRHFVFPVLLRKTKDVFTTYRLENLPLWVINWLPYHRLTKSQKCVSW